MVTFLTVILGLILVFLLAMAILMTNEIFKLVILKSPPFLPTETKVYHEVVSYLNKRYGDKGITIVEMGSGANRGQFIFSENPHWQVVGYEFSPRPFIMGLLKKCWHKKKPNMKTFYKDFYKVNVSEADVIYSYLFAETNQKLEPKLKAELKPGSIIVSYAFKFPDWIPLETIVLTHARHPNIYIYTV